MLNRLTTLIAVMLASVPLAACGSDDGGSSPATTTEQASAAVKAKLLDCLRQGRIRIVPSGKVGVTVQGRVPRVPVPAEYLGAAVLPTSGFYDLWLASDPDSATAAAEELNDALAQKLESEAQEASAQGLAFAEGPVVSAVGGNVTIGKPREIVPLLRCPDRL